MIPKPINSSINNDRDNLIKISVNGRIINAHKNETLSSILIAAGYKTLRHTEYSHTPRGIYCSMGVCYECMVTVNGQPFTRACKTIVAHEMIVETDNIIAEPT
jgi:aerobic-type carbon monoxide dehydrogenase small subunit (CoxS/CutS family)